MPRLRFAVLCASNQNRSMEAHNVLKEHGFDIRSFGTGTAVRLPGPSIDKPNIYSFGTPYNDIFNELLRKDKHLYTQNGLLAMLDRNRKIKRAPERFQETQETFDVVFTCEERCFDAACDTILNRKQHCNKPAHIINIEIIDNHEQAAVGGKLILQLAQKIEQSTDLDQEIDELLEDYISQTGANVLHTVTYF
ncbi:RNA polymerase II subunit A C-terminal domain phosphatase [Polyrhizophydium stewartii]|uniref:RNA polymerase II subunit A C-terminal domain phosphatase SSU72 n=1 Tax=Polyrhizophydium stewartii TaxID=2732419 RepID=A0ABR4N5T4_9FUNG|nr:RNA polymerase II subunit A C-terminal domain phosphatase [Polyrhizophydium stewartii]